MQLTSITVSSVLAVALLPALMLADAKYDFPNNPIVYEGEVVVLRSSLYPDLHLALYLDDGHYSNHGGRAEVRRVSDIGGDLARCDGIEACVEVGGVGGVGGTPVMAPPTGQTAWRRGPYDLRLVSGDPSIGDAVVTATRYDGLEAVSYGYSTACGVTWINFSNGDEVFYPEGRSLFWTQACTDGAAMMPTK